MKGYKDAWTHFLLSLTDWEKTETYETHKEIYSQVLQTAKELPKTKKGWGELKNKIEVMKHNYFLDNETEKERAALNLRELIGMAQMRCLRG